LAQPTAATGNTAGVANWDFVSAIPSYDVSASYDMREVRRHLRRECAGILEAWLRDKEPLLEQLEPDALVSALQERLLQGLDQAAGPAVVKTTTTIPVVSAMLLTPPPSLEARILTQNCGSLFSRSLA
jgi:hypothetical protein